MAATVCARRPGLAASGVSIVSLSRSLSEDSSIAREYGWQSDLLATVASSDRARGLDLVSSAATYADDRVPNAPSPVVG